MSDPKRRGLTGEGFSREEADAIYENFQPIPMTPEERKAYVERLKQVLASTSEAQQDSPPPVETGAPS